MTLFPLAVKRRWQRRFTQFTLYKSVWTKIEKMQFLTLMTQAHMRMTVPPTRGFSYDNSPISADQFPCKGLPAITPAPIQAGSSVTAHIAGTAAHGGGFCQWSLSYDGGKEFISIHTLTTGCPTANTDYSIPIPGNIPNGQAILYWSWMNEIGNREFYANCADVAVSGSTGTDYRGSKIVVGNIEHNGALISFPEQHVSIEAKKVFEEAEKNKIGFTGVSVSNSPMTPVGTTAGIPETNSVASMPTLLPIPGPSVQTETLTAMESETQLLPQITEAQETTPSLVYKRCIRKCNRHK